MDYVFSLTDTDTTDIKNTGKKKDKKMSVKPKKNPQKY